MLYLNIFNTLFPGYEDAVIGVHNLKLKANNC